LPSLIGLPRKASCTGEYTFSLPSSTPASHTIYRIVYFNLAGFIERTKYYAVWTLAEGISILTGSGFTGFGPAGESRWEGAANVDIFRIEFAPNFKVLLDSWNMKTNVWLRECVYKRVTPKGKKPGFKSTVITFGTSAFWVSWSHLPASAFTTDTVLV